MDTHDVITHIDKTFSRSLGLFRLLDYKAPMRTFLSFLIVFSLGLTALAAPPRSPEEERKIEALTKELGRIGLTESQISAVVKAVYMPFIEVAIRKAQENYLWLKDQGVKNPGALIERFPSVLGMSIEENLEPKVVWLTKQSVENPGALIEKFSAVLSYSIEENLEPKVVWLTKQGVKNPSALIEKFPQVLGYSIEENLEPKVTWLKRIGVKNPGALIEKFPQVLGLSIEESLEPKVTWLKRVGVKNPGALIEKFPQVLGLSIEENLEPKVTWLKRVGVKNPGALIKKLPTVLSLNIEENLDLKIEWFTEVGVKNPVALIEKFPAVLNYSVEENLKPTILSLLRDWGLELSFIEARPILLGASLKRMQDLITALNHLRIKVSQHLTNQQKKVAIQNLKVSDLVENLKLLGLIKPEVESILAVPKEELPSQEDLLRTLPKWLKKAPAASQCTQLLAG